MADWSGYQLWGAILAISVISAIAAVLDTQDRERSYFEKMWPVFSLQCTLLLLALALRATFFLP